MTATIAADMIEWINATVHPSAPPVVVEPVAHLGDAHSAMEAISGPAFTFEADGRLWVCNRQGGRFLARWCAENRVDFAEVASLNADGVRRVVDPGSIVTEKGKLIPWTTATADGGCMPPRWLSQRNNGRLRGPIRISVGGAA